MSSKILPKFSKKATLFIFQQENKITSNVIQRITMIQLKMALLCTQDMKKITSLVPKYICEILDSDVYYY